MRNHFFNCYLHWTLARVNHERKKKWSHGASRLHVTNHAMLVFVATFYPIKCLFLGVFWSQLVLLQQHFNPLPCVIFQCLHFNRWGIFFKIKLHCNVACVNHIKKKKWSNGANRLHVTNHTMLVCVSTFCPIECQI